MDVQRFFKTLAELYARQHKAEVVSLEVHKRHPARAPK